MYVNVFRYIGKFSTIISLRIFSALFCHSSLSDTSIINMYVVLDGVPQSSKALFIQFFSFLQMA